MYKLDEWSLENKIQEYEKEKTEEYYVKKYGADMAVKRADYFIQLAKDTVKLKIDARENLEELTLKIVNHLCIYAGKLGLKYDVDIYANDWLEIDSNNIIDCAGVMVHTLSELKVVDFGSYTSDSEYDVRGGYYQNDKDYDYGNNKAKPVISVNIHFSYQHLSGGSNGSDLGWATYTEENGWEVKWQDR